MTARGLRNNNPGNIIQSGIAWQGKLDNPTDSRFEQFDTAQNGIRALAKLVISYQDKHGLRTVRGIINRWAPPVENNTTAYVIAVANAVGVKPDDTIDVYRHETLVALTTAIIRHENGEQPYAARMIDEAVASALGTSVAPTKPVPVESAPPKLNQRKDAPMGASLIAGLVSALIQGFAPKAEQVVTAALDKHGIDSTVGQTIVKTIANAVQPGIMEAPPQEQIEVFAAASKSAATITAAETSALDYLDKLAPLLDKIASQEQAMWAANDESADRAAARGQRDKLDLAPILVRQSGYAFLIGAIAVIGLMAYQMYLSDDGDIDGAMYGLLSLLIYGVVRMMDRPSAYRFGGAFESTTVETGNAIVRDAAQRAK